MAPPPPTQNEQLALDELLNDIYRGIETLPDHNLSPEEIAERANQVSGNRYKLTHYNQQVKHYELPSSSPIVRQHKQEIEKARGKSSEQQDTQYPFAAYSPAQNTNNNNLSSPQPGRSTLKRQQQQAQSLASFITTDLQQQQQQQNPNQVDGGTSKRRVRIVEHPEKLAKQKQQEHQQHQYKNNNYPAPGSPYARFDEERPNVKYVNTNQLIYHEEPASKWNNEHDSVYTPVIDQDVLDQYEQDEEANNSDGQDVDGQTKVEYYHTSWLDRQLGRASKRRNSKELNERQVKEKAMIEELKRSLKNGAITLKRSLKGGNKASKRQDSSNNQNIYHGQYIGSNRTADDQLNSYTDRPAQRASSIFATIPRKPSQANKNNNLSFTNTYNQYDSKYDLDSAEPISTHNNHNIEQQENYHKSSPITSDSQQQYSSRTLPNQGKHQLIKSHYKANQYQQQPIHQPPPQQKPIINNKSTNNDRDNIYAMRYPQSSTIGHKPHPQQNCQPTSQQYNTISRIPSATEVVRSALDKSKSHQEDQRLRKTINSLESPSPYPSSPQTPTHQLKAASPSLSPSPIGSPNPCSPSNNNNLINTNQQVLRGTRIIPAASPISQTNTTTSNLNKQPTVYANPHTSLMQHRAEQQARGIYGSPAHQQYNRGPNQASLREFNELDSLLKSLSPNGQPTTTTRNYTTPSTGSGMGAMQTPTPTLLASSGPSVGPKSQISPAYSNKPAQATLGGYGGIFPAQQQQQQSPDVYAKIQRQQPQSKPLQTSNLNNSNFTLDVTDDRSTLERPQKQQQHQWDSNNKVSQQYEILPSMEDYQNISKLNPVRNHYWYKPNMSRERAISLLKDKPQGTFIVRDSNSFKGAYGLAVKVAKLPQNVLNNSSLRDPRANPSDELIRHFLIEPTASGVRLKGYANEPVFGSLPNLIYQHSLTELALPCRLIIPRADIEDPQFNLKQKQFFEEFLASKEEAKHTPYERTSPNGGYRIYPGNVAVHNEHRIIFQ